MLSIALCLTACGGEPKTPEEQWIELRKEAAKSKSGEEVADWLVAELLRPGGDPAQAKKARKRLDELEAHGMVAEVARGLDDLSHGRVKASTEAYQRAVMAASTSDDPRAPLVGWFAALHVAELSGQARDFGKRHRAEFELLLAEPGNLGFRGYASVVELWADDAHASAQSDVDEQLADKLGCVRHLRMAGPFGDTPEVDVLRAFAPERPGPWPERFVADGVDEVPRRLSTERVGCDVEVDEPVGGGVFYAETYLNLDRPEDLVLSASAATRVWIDDQLVLDRDVRTWGIWPKFGVRVKLGRGVHRVLWKTANAGTALRVVRPDGRPWNGQSSTDASRGYELGRVVVGADPNDLMRYIGARGINDPGDDLTRYVAAYLANREGQPDAATLLLEPLVTEPDEATGLALSSAALFVLSDPIYDRNQTTELAHELEVRAANRDPGLWFPRLKNALWIATQKGPAEAVQGLEELVKTFPEVAATHTTLAQAYEQLGWGPEHERAVFRLADSFPDDPDAIALAIDYHESAGHREKVDALLAHLREVAPESEVFVGRALTRRDYALAKEELERLAERRPSRRDIAARLGSLLVRRGVEKETTKLLEEAIEREPRDVHSRLALADFQLARGRKSALAEALVEAVQAGSDPSMIEEAIDLVEGRTELEPYRLDALSIIRDYEASGRHQPGTAARVLDYGAVLVRSDGSSRFLEHEVVRIQSEEGIKQFTEMDSSGLVLHLRVIKKDGTQLEPEEVEGKPSVTMPHLEIGDYVEQERILTSWGSGGARYIGPSWFFREQNVAYARSEFVVVTPKDKQLFLEAQNGAPTPSVEERGSFVVRRYRADQSPAAPTEPGSPPASEFMPRVSVGWGVSFERRIRDVSRSTFDTSAVDPRIRRIAKNIVKGKGKSKSEQARALYHWVLDSVQEGSEADGRRVVVSRSGNLWNGYVTLARALDIEVRWALAESRLSSPIVGPLSSATRPLAPLLVVGSGKEATWLTIDDKFAPYGTVPGHLRGEPAYVLGGDEAVVTKVPASGAEDAIAYQGVGTLRADGSAKLSLDIVFAGKFAAGLRNGLSQIPENQLADIIESRLLGQELAGARLLSHEVRDRDALDRPLVLHVEVEAPQLATRSGDGLLLAAPFMPELGQLAPLSERATPLLLTESSRQELDLRLALPANLGATVMRAEGTAEAQRYAVTDTTSGGVLHLRRDVVTRAGRVPPERYGDFQRFAREADAALTRAVRIGK